MKPRKNNQFKIFSEVNKIAIPNLDKIVKKLKFKITLNKTNTIKRIETQSDIWKNYRRMKLKKKIQFYKLFYIKQIVIKRAGTKYERKINWRATLKL